MFGGARHLALAGGAIRGEARAWPSPMHDAYPALLAHRGRPAVVLASGDPFEFGVGSVLAALVAAGEWRCLPAPSAFALACARLGWARQDVACLSFCGRPVAALLPHLHPGRRILALSADAATPGEVAALLAARGFGPSPLHVLEALGATRERVRVARASDGVRGDIDPLNLLGIEVVAGPGARVIPLGAGLDDALFEHDGQITKREVRAATLAALAPRVGELLWDIGAGSGSVAVEWLLAHPANRAIGIEPRPERAARAARNAQAMGVHLVVREGRAPAALAGLPPPDAVFIGGGMTGDGVLDAAWAALRAGGRAGGRIVANAVTIETEAVLFAAHAAHGGTLTRIAVERLDAVGRMHGFRPAMTVTQWAAMQP